MKLCSSDISIQSQVSNIHLTDSNQGSTVYNSLIKTAIWKVLKYNFDFMQNRNSLLVQTYNKLHPPQSTPLNKERSFTVR